MEFLDYLPEYWIRLKCWIGIHDGGEIGRGQIVVTSKKQTDGAAAWDVGGQEMLPLPGDIRQSFGG